MSLLREIQQSLLDGEDLGPILLKLRYLASRLGSDPLEEWVKHESEGYPSGIEVPEYRKVGVAYTASFSGPFGASIRNAPIPPYLIEKHAGKQWTTHEVRESLSGVENLIEQGKTGGGLAINAADLILLLQGKVYEDYACNSVTGRISPAAVTEIQSVVRSRVLDLMVELERSIPEAAEITLSPLDAAPVIKDADAISHITQQIIYGNVTAITSTGEGAQFLLNIGKGDSDALAKALVDAGIAKSDATELASIVATEEPESKDDPFGKKAKAWLARNIPKAVNGTWQIGMVVATKVLTEAMMRYYGFK